MMEKALLPTQLQKNTKNPGVAATAREQQATKEGESREAVAARTSRKSFCNCPQRKRKAEKALVCCAEGRRGLHR